jgi:hypothetical protein
MQKLSEWCKEHITNLSYDTGSWKQKVHIQKSQTMTLVYFISNKLEETEKGTWEEIDVTTIIWFDKKGKIFMIDGRFGGNFFPHILNTVKREEKVILDFEECLKIDGVFLA